MRKKESDRLNVVCAPKLPQMCICVFWIRFNSKGMFEISLLVTAFGNKVGWDIELALNVQPLKNGSWLPSTQLYMLHFRQAGYRHGGCRTRKKLRACWRSSCRCRCKWRLDVRASAVNNALHYSVDGINTQVTKPSRRLAERRPR
jgi:hypothetical protein